jgi:hypothetical protein
MIREVRNPAPPERPTPHVSPVTADSFVVGSRDGANSTLGG